MRTVQPAGLEKDSTPEKAKTENEFIFNLTIPLRLIKEKLFISLIIGRDLREFSRPSSVAPGYRALNLFIMYGLIVLICLAVLSGFVFLLYLIKSLLGVDVFPGSHVVYNGIGNNFWSLN